MGLRYEFVYIIAIVFCIANTFIIISKLSYNFGSAMEIRTFKRMTFSYIAYLILELIWVLGVAKIIPMGEVPMGLVKMLDTMMIPLMVFFWFIFAMTRFRSKWLPNPKFRLLAAIPLILMVFIYVTSFGTGLVFRIDGSHFTEGPLIALTGIVDNLYELAIISYAVVSMIRKRNIIRKDEYRIQIIFILFCTLGGFLDASFEMTPGMPLSITLSFNYLFMHILEGQIYNDALTGLNNRRRADDYIEESVESSSKDSPCYIFIMDIDKFKDINDTYGHLEGDRALKLVADAMRRVAGRYKGLLSRWGGDEFMLVLRNQPDLDPEEVVRASDEEIQNMASVKNLPFEISVSMGYCKSESGTTSVNSFIAAADRMMYQRKHSKG